ncbi:MAG: response regulator transcription factor [Anaerolineae bacterium]|nr:response regulator transcription factor [Anaerolineae bacterium]
MSIRVVLADDHKVIREGLRAILSGQAEIDIVGDACDGLAAVEQVRQLKPDVIVMDINMPLMNGIDAARRISEIRNQTRVIILSMHSNNEHIFQALKAGAKGYLLKESSGLEIADAIRRVHTGGRYMSETITDSIVEDYIAFRENAAVVSPVEQLSAREREVMHLAIEGKSSAEIAALLHLSLSTVNTYRSRLMGKLGVSDIASLVRFAAEHGLMSVS